MNGEVGGKSEGAVRETQIPEGVEHQAQNPEGVEHQAQNPEGVEHQVRTSEDGTPWMRVVRRYPGRHVLLGVALVLLGAYFLLREVPAVADFATHYIAWPWQWFFGVVFDVFPFSVMELFCALVVVGLLVYVGVTLVKIIREPKKLQHAYAALIAILAVVLMAYALLCWLWSISFYSDAFTEFSGIETEATSVEELKEVTIYFAEAANAAAEAVPRDENGLYACDIQKTFAEAPALYANLPAQFAFLDGPELHPKPMAFSYIMSCTNFTGMFFPLTGEANINVDAPDSGLPSTVAHELAHQHGVPREQDANFTAVLVCMESGDANFMYSGALLAYNHLARALKQASPEDWEEARTYLGESARKDLNASSEYWKQFQTPAADITEAAYDGFLHSQGQELGMKSYGACVDLLVAYYGEAAKAS